MEDGKKNNIPTERKMDKQNIRLTPWSRQQNQDNKIKTRRSVGRPKRRWEDDTNEFMRPGETKYERKYDLKNNSSRMTEAKKLS